MNNKINVVYDDTIFRIQKKGGISNVFNGLIGSLVQSTTIYPKRIISGKHKSIYGDFKSAEVTNSRLRIPRWAVQFSPIFLKEKEGEIFHTTYMNTLGFKNKMISVCTLHDFGYERNIMQTGFKRIVNIVSKKYLIMQSDAIVCVSQSTCNDLFHYYRGLIKDKFVSVVHNGIDDAYFDEEKSMPIVQQPYILFVGSRKRYKNFHLVVEMLKIKLKLKLVIAGGEDFSQSEKNDLKQFSNRIKFVRDPSVIVLRNLYKNALCLIYPSQYEGFGLPVVEAFACGCPVIAGHNSSIVEIASNGGAVLIKDYSADEIARVVTSFENGFNRARLVWNGINVAKGFRHKNFIEKMENFYHKIVQIKK